MTRKGRRRLFALCGIVALVPVFFALRLFMSALALSGSKSSSLERASVSASDLPVSITVFGRSSDTISARLAFYTTDGALVSTLERSWAGWEIKIDCVLVRTKSGWLVFPFSMSTDVAGGGKGVNILRYYDRSGFPAIYESSRLSAGERIALRRLFSVVRTECWLPRSFGNVHHEVVVIRSFDPNVEYELRVSTDGHLGFSSD